jgi:tRNA pseudouridine38-40 synthase
MRMALGIEYNGANFYGWQRQADVPTVQQAIEQALQAFTLENIAVNVAGRTDAGVHALEQVIHFDTTCIRKDFSWVRGLNGLLKRKNICDISILWASNVSDEFHARFSAVGRTYHYILYVGRTAPACLHKKIGYVMNTDAKLNTNAMLESSKYLIGQHDFSSFRASICQSKTPVKTMYNINIIDKNPYYIFTISANAFLHHMVRNLIACFIQIGLNKRPACWMKNVLEAKNRSAAAPTFMPDGLYLANIDYHQHNIGQVKPIMPWLI